MMTSTTEENETKIRSKLVWQFNIMVGLFVLVCSFGYGISKGVTAVKPAFATLNQFAAEEPLSKHAKFLLPRGVKARPMGKNMRVNGREAELISFQSNRKIKPLLAEATRHWEKIGIEVVGVATGKRGLVVGTSPGKKLRLSLNAWVVPGKIARMANDGYRVQGALTIAPMSEPGGSISEREGLVPGVPTLPGGKAGALVSSDDPNGRSFSGSYTNPGTVEQSYEFYLTFMLNQGWIMDEGIVQHDYGYLRFTNGNRELSFLLSPSRTTNTEETVAIVTLGGKLFN